MASRVWRSTVSIAGNDKGSIGQGYSIGDVSQYICARRGGMIPPVVIGGHVISDSGIDSTEEWQGEGTLLIADDEEVVRTIAGSMCEFLGFGVLYAEDGIEALDVFRQHHQKIVSVLLDISMPRMDGTEVMHKMRSIDPGVPIILVSGDSETEVALLADIEQMDGFVQKPFRIQSLKNVLLQVLQKP